MASSHTHDSQCGGALVEPAVFECLECGTRFEDGVADADADGAPRCPQCGFASATLAARDVGTGFVVRRSTRFR